MFKVLALFAVIFLFSQCTTNNTTQPESAATPVNRDSIRQFILDSLALADTSDTTKPPDSVNNRYYFLQGNIQSTGKMWDLALEGDNALFALELDSTLYFLRRPGKFFVDKDGYVVKEFDGPRLLGWKVDSTVRDTSTQDSGSVSPETSLVPIRIPIGSLYSPPRASTFVKYQGNLNGDSEGLGTILYTQPFYHRADEFNTAACNLAYGTDNDIGANGAVGGTAVLFANIATDASAIGSIKLTGVHAASGQSLQIKTGDLLIVTATILNNHGVDETQTALFEVIDDPAMAGRIGVSATSYQVATLAQFLLAMQTFLSGAAWNGGSGSNASGVNIAIMPDGKIRIENGSTSTQAIKALTVSSNRPISRTYATSAFAFNSQIPANSYTDTPDHLLRPALAGDPLYNPLYYDMAGNPEGVGGSVPAIFTANGQTIDLEQSDKVNITALIGGNPKNSNLLQIKEGTTLNDPSSTAMQDILDAIQNTLYLPERDGSIRNNLSVDINAVGTEDDLIPEGAIVIRGQPELFAAINNFSVIACNSNAATEAPTDFNTNMVVTQLQAARASGVFDTSIEIYDSFGNAHTLTIRFVHSGITSPATWNWEMTTNKGENIVAGRTGLITFGQDGSPSSFTYDSIGATAVKIDPGNGAAIITVNLNCGSSGAYTGITQFYVPTTVAAVAQDGYPGGRLEEVAVDEFGQVSGAFSNGITSNLWTIALAEFPCQIGLKSVGYDYFVKTNYSGSPLYGKAGISIGAVIHPGAIELEP